MPAGPSPVKCVYLPAEDWARVRAALTATADLTAEPAQCVDCDKTRPVLCEDHAPADRDAVELRRIEHTIDLQTGSLGMGTVADLAKATGLPDDANVEEVLEGLPMLVLNCLLRNDYDTIGDLKRCNDGDLLDIRNFGEGCLGKLKNHLFTVAQAR
ncbi:DNA-directed RNA polymerase subunit alpha C-terminal domain-containing protein [Microbispora amethystogenes]|uniref:DNA-directed RNA polymerase subunit alpha C-terminal domain-containing protein n=1 Tax=Microbispora amethystogenes TaxID=1427754 RepID=UPI0033D647CC